MGQKKKYDLFIIPGFFEKQRERETDRQVQVDKQNSHPLAHSSNTRNMESEPGRGQELGTQCRLRVGGGELTVGAVTCYIPGCALAGNQNWKQSQNPDPGSPVQDVIMPIDS